jgi:hypothetical protein
VIKQDRCTELIAYIELAMIPEMGEAAMIDFTVNLFKAVKYVRRNRLSRTRMDLPLLICGENRHAKTNVCLLDYPQNEILLVVQADKDLEHGPIDSPAQLIAEAVAAFNKNNAQREVAGHPPLAEKVSHSVSLLTLF